jgi:hypothetical protein
MSIIHAGLLDKSCQHKCSQRQTSHLTMNWTLKVGWYLDAVWSEGRPHRDDVSECLHTPAHIPTPHPLSPSPITYQKVSPIETNRWKTKFSQIGRTVLELFHSVYLRWLNAPNMYSWPRIWEVHLTNSKHIANTCSIQTVCLFCCVWPDAVWSEGRPHRDEQMK